jgi:predicted ATPase
MINSIRIKNFKGIRSLDLSALGPLHILVGPNSSGKSTFLDAIEFVRSCLESGPLKAVEERVPEFRDLTYMRKGGPIEIELWLDLSASLPARKDLLHYRIAIVDDERIGVRVADEVLQLQGKAKRRRFVGKTSSGTYFYQREDGRYQDVFDFGLGKLALSLTPPDQYRYPTANTAKAFLTRGIRYMQLNSRAMRDPCPATRSTDLELDGTNLARVVGRLIRSANGNHSSSQPSGPVDTLDSWTDHLRYALDDLQAIGWAAREPDRAEYIILKYAGGLECPSWLLSDGTLRMLALTLPAFLPASPTIYMVEEPENGVHPKALEIILKALAGIPEAQVFIATHSPLVVQEEGVDVLLCFTRDDQGVHTVPGNKHPALQDWKGVPDLATIFSSRVLG